MKSFLDECAEMIAERQKVLEGAVILQMEIDALEIVKAMLEKRHTNQALPKATTGAKKPSLRPGDVPPRNPNVYCKACGANVVSKEHAEKCGHAHRWRIASPDGPLSAATCQIDGCEATAQFANSMDPLGREP